MRNICFFICSLVNTLAIPAPPKKNDKQTITSQLEEEQVNVFFFFFIFGSKNVKIEEHYQEHKKQGMECLDEVQEVK